MDYHELMRLTVYMCSMFYVSLLKSSQGDIDLHFPAVPFVMCKTCHWHAIRPYLAAKNSEIEVKRFTTWGCIIWNPMSAIVCRRDIQHVANTRLRQVFKTCQFTTMSLKRLWKNYSCWIKKLESWRRFFTLFIVLSTCKKAFSEHLLTIH